MEFGHELKQVFPLLKNNSELVYLDNAATTHKPQVVLEAISKFYTEINANVHRGIYDLSEKATSAYEQARQQVARFINAEAKEIVFTAGATQALNMLAESLFLSKRFTADTMIVLSELEHHANILPWQRHSSNIQYLPVKEAVIDLESLASWLSNSSSNVIISLSLTSNVTGAQLDVKRLQNILKPYRDKVTLILDICQTVAHQQVDVVDLDTDFCVFSGHKLYGPTGVGVLYGRQEQLEALEPLQLGGGMVQYVDKHSAAWKKIPQKHEAGTPPLAGALGLAAACKFVTELGLDNIKNYERELADYAAAKISQFTWLDLHHDIQGAAVLSFSSEQIHAHDISQILSDHQVAVRAGHHCTQILHRDVLGVNTTTRVSCSVYNTQANIDKLVSGLNSVQRVFAI